MRSAFPKISGPFITLRLWAVIGLIAALSLGFGVVHSSAADHDQPMEPVVMRFGFTPTAFLQSNRNDVEAALRVLAQQVGHDEGFSVTVTTELFIEPAALLDAAERGSINFAVLDSLTFVTRERWGDLTACFIPKTGDHSGRRYLLMVRRGSGLQSVTDLKGKTLIELQSPDLNAGHAWLQSILRGPVDPEHFFESIDYVGKPATAVLPVFFGKRDACIADEASFKLMLELNPQVGEQLEVLARSEPLVGTIMCASESNWTTPAFRPVLLKALGELQTNPAGRQILSLFKVDQLIPYQKALLATVHTLRNQVHTSPISTAGKLP